MPFAGGFPPWWHHTAGQAVSPSHYRPDWPLVADLRTSVEAESVTVANHNSQGFNVLTMDGSVRWVARQGSPNPDSDSGGFGNWPFHDQTALTGSTIWKFFLEKQ